MGSVLSRCSGHPLRVGEMVLNLIRQESEVLQGHIDTQKVTFHMRRKRAFQKKNTPLTTGAFRDIGFRH